MIALLHFLLTATALARDPMGEPDGHRPPSCDINSINACVSQNRAASASSLANAGAAADKMRLLNKDLDTLSSAEVTLSGEINSLSSEEQVITAETTTMKMAPENFAVPIFSGFPSAEELFHLLPDDLDWNDRYPEERGQKLSERLSQISPALTERKLEDSKYSQDINALRSQISTFQAAYNAAMGEASQHDAMSNSGCRAQFCGGGQ
jgi:chromosome segregation ATPase